MVRASHQRVLLIGDVDRQMYSTVTQAMPQAEVKSVNTLFDGIAELSVEHYTTVLASVEPMERRPESAVRTLRELSGDGRLLLFGHPTLEPLSQKMLEFGCDDYLITPITPGEFLETLGSPRSKKTGDEPSDQTPAPAANQLEEKITTVRPATDEASPLLQLSIANLVLDSLVNSPQDPFGGTLRQINSVLPPMFNVFMTGADAAVPTPAEGLVVVSHRPSDLATGAANEIPPFGRGLHLSFPADHDRPTAVKFLAELAANFARVQVLHERNIGLQRLAITDDPHQDRREGAFEAIFGDAVPLRYR